MEDVEDVEDPAYIMGERHAYCQACGVPILLFECEDEHCDNC